MKTLEYEVEGRGEYSEQFDEEMCESETYSIEVPQDEVDDVIVDCLFLDYFYGKEFRDKTIEKAIKEALLGVIYGMDIGEQLEEYYDEELHDAFRDRL